MFSWVFCFFPRGIVFYVLSWSPYRLSFRALPTLVLGSLSTIKYATHVDGGVRSSPSPFPPLIPKGPTTSVRGLPNPPPLLKSSRCDRPKLQNFEVHTRPSFPPPSLPSPPFGPTLDFPSTRSRRPNSPLNLSHG